MNKSFGVSAAIWVVILTAWPVMGQTYRWFEGGLVTETVEERFSPPPGYVRVPVATAGFGHWLRHLPLKPDGAKVMQHDGRPKSNQDVQAAVIGIDVGDRDLQQCADAVIRLRAEYLYDRGHTDSIWFTFTSGDTARWRDWINGQRPTVDGNQVTWTQSGSRDSSYQSFRRYLNTVFSYAGTISLQRDSAPKWSTCNIAIGDFFVAGGSPGHAVLVVDLAEDSTTGQRMFLLAQSYMPAQDIHILVNPNDPAISPWYPCECEDRLVTPEWTFACDELRQFQPFFIEP